MFEDMLQRSIPDYGSMRGLCFELGSRFVKPGTWIVDVGCARGEALAPFVERFGASVSYLGTDVSEPMVAAARERFASPSASEGGVEVVIESLDLERDVPRRRSSLTLCVLTLQFVTPARRPGILRELFENTVEGGALVLVEKLVGATPGLDGVLLEQYRDFKRRRGYSDAEIYAKEESLRDVLFPLTASQNEEALRAAGFAEVDCFWRCLNFAGWIAVRSG